MNIFARMLMSVPVAPTVPQLAICVPLEGQIGLDLQCRPAEVERLMSDICSDDRRAEVLMSAVRLIESYEDDEDDELDDYLDAA